MQMTPTKIVLHILTSNGQSFHSEPCFVRYRDHKCTNTACEASPHVVTPTLDGTVVSFIVRNEPHHAARAVFTRHSEKPRGSYTVASGWKCRSDARTHVGSTVSWVFGFFCCFFDPGWVLAPGFLLTIILEGRSSDRLSRRRGLPWQEIALICLIQHLQVQHARVLRVHTETF